MPKFRPSALRAARKRAGITQHELARMVGVAGGERISLWERGEIVPRARTVGALAKALDVPVDELLGITLESADLRALRRRAALRTREIAKIAVVSVSTYERWERGSGRPPSREALLRMAHAFDVSEAVVRRAVNMPRDDRK